MLAALRERSLFVSFPLKSGGKLTCRSHSVQTLRKNFGVNRGCLKTNIFDGWDELRGTYKLTGEVISKSDLYEFVASHGKANKHNKEHPEGWEGNVEGSVQFSIYLQRSSPNLSLVYFGGSSSIKSSSGFYKKVSTGCYVATCVYGASNSHEVLALQRFRDDVLEKSWIGKKFIDFYYAVSPRAVSIFGNMRWFHVLCKFLLDCFVRKLNKNKIKKKVN